ncbi:MAG: hypothetical protein ACRD0A_19400 [Acidimicrobiales bacterium]
MPDVEHALVDLAQHLDHPRGGDLGETVAARLRDGGSGGMVTTSRRRLLTTAAVVVAVLAVLALALPQPRRAVARWFGIGGVQLTLRGEGVADPEAMASELDLGRPVTVAEAAQAAPFAIALPADVGPPSAAFAGRPPDAVTFVWAPSDDLQEVDGSGVGLLVTEFPGATDDSLVVKELGPGTQVEQLSVDGHDGYWITGARHVVTYVDPAGEPQFDPTRLAGNTLLWQVGDVTNRMEGELDLDRMLALAESFRIVS